MEKQQAFSQPDHEEKQNLDGLMDLLRKSDKIQTDNQSLAATVARLFADLIDSSWTWEGALSFITKMCLLADQFSDLANGQSAPRLGYHVRILIKISVWLA